MLASVTLAIELYVVKVGLLGCYSPLLWFCIVKRLFSASKNSKQLFFCKLYPALTIAHRLRYYIKQYNDEEEEEQQQVVAVAEAAAAAAAAAVLMGGGEGGCDRMEESR